MNVIRKILNGFRDLCESNNEIPLMIIVGAQRKEGVMPKIYYNPEMSVEEVQDALFQVLITLKETGNNANKN